MSHAPAIILVHGAWHGPWCWQDTAERLRVSGRTVRTPTLPGRSAGDAHRCAQVTLRDWADVICAIAAEEKGRSLVVAHSLSGMAAALAAEINPELFVGTVYVGALLPWNGASGRDVMSVHGEPTRAIGPFIERDVSSGLVRLKDDPAIERLLYGDCPPDVTRAARARLVPESLLPGSTRVALSEGRFGSVPRGFIECLRDDCVPLEVQREAQRRSPCRRVVSMDTGHSPFLERPEDFVRALLEIEKDLEE